MPEMEDNVSDMSDHSVTLAAPDVGMTKSSCMSVKASVPWCLVLRDLADVSAMNEQRTPTTDIPSSK